MSIAVNREVPAVKDGTAARRAHLVRVIGNVRSASVDNPDATFQSNEVVGLVIAVTQSQLIISQRLRGRQTKTLISEKRRAFDARDSKQVEALASFVTDMLGQ